MYAFGFDSLIPNLFSYSQYDVRDIDILIKRIGFPSKDGKPF